MIPYTRFDFDSVEAIGLAKYDKLSVPFVHYRPVKAIMLDDRFVLVHNRGIWDTQNQRAVAIPTPAGVRFSLGARLAYKEITPLISPWKLKKVSGIWAVETTDRILIYREETITRTLYQLTPDTITMHHEAVNGLEAYVEGLDLQEELSDHSFDLCAQCNTRQSTHLDFHICRSEIGARLLSELTGMVRDEHLVSEVSLVKARLLNVLKLVRGSVVGPLRVLPVASRDAEEYFTTDCPWGHQVGLRW